MTCFQRIHSTESLQIYLFQRIEFASYFRMIKDFFPQKKRLLRRKFPRSPLKRPVLKKGPSWEYCIRYFFLMVPESIHRLHCICFFQKQTKIIFQCLPTIEIINIKKRKHVIKETHSFTIHVLYNILKEKSNLTADSRFEVSSV